MHIPTITAEPAIQPIIPPYADDPEAMENINISLELGTIFEVLNDRARNDPLSQALIVWHTSFTNSLNEPRRNLNRVIAEYIAKLQELLASPLPPFEPLDKEALLGTDGKTYGKKSLHIFLSADVRPTNEHYRSPFAPLENTPFFVEPHPVASTLVAWLEGRNATLPQPNDLQRHYDELFNAGRLSPLPLGHQTGRKARPPRRNYAERRQREQAERAQYLQEEADQNDALIEGLTRQLGNIGNEMRSTFGLITNNATQAMNETAQRTEVIAQRQTAQLTATENGINQLIDEVAILDRSNRELDRQITQIQQTVDQRTYDNRRETRAIDQAQTHARQDQELSQLSEVLQANAREATQAFHSAVGSIENSLGQSNQQMNTLERLEQVRQNNLNTDLVVLADDIAAVMRDGGSLNRNVQQLEGRVNQQIYDVRRSTREIEAMTDDEYCRQELNNLLRLLVQLPDPVIEHIGPFARRLAQDFREDEQMVQNLENVTAEILRELQVEIVENRFGNVAKELKVLEVRHDKLVAQTTLLTGKVHEAELSEVQLELYMNKVEQMVKKLKKSQLQGIMMTGLKVGGSLLLTWGASYVLEETVVETVGINGLEIFSPKIIF